LRFVTAIKARRASRLHRGYRQQPVEQSDEQAVYNARVAWMFLGMVM